MLASDNLSVTDQANKEVDTPGGLPRTIPTAQELRLQAAQKGTLDERLALSREISPDESFLPLKLVIKLKQKTKIQIYALKIGIFQP